MVKGGYELVLFISKNYICININIYVNALGCQKFEMGWKLQACYKRDML